MKLFKTSFLLTTLVTGATAMAQFTLVDNFETFTAGQTVDGVNGWTVIDRFGDPLNNSVTTDPSDAGNLVLDVFGDVQGENSNVPAGIAQGDTGTLFFRFQVPSGNAPDLSIGLSDLGTSAVRDGTDIGLTFRINNSTLQVYDGGFQTVGSGITADSWYSVWLVADNDAESWQAYIQGGTEYASQTLLDFGGDDSFAFRRDPDDGDGNFNTFAIRGNNSHLNQRAFIDDIYIDGTNANLGAIPEPSVSALLMGLGVVLFVLRRRMA